MAYSFSLLFLLLAYWQFRSFRVLRHLKQHGQKTPARVTEKALKEGKWGIEKCTLHYTYTDAQGGLHQGQSMVHPSVFRKVQEGGDVEVLYLKENPRQSLLYTVYIDRMSVVMALMLVSVASAVVVPIVF